MAAMPIPLWFSDSMAGHSLGHYNIFLNIQVMLLVLYLILPKMSLFIKNVMKIPSFEFA